MAIFDSIIWYWPLDTTGGSVNFIMLLNWTVLILYNYFNAMFVGPGYITLGWKPVRISVSWMGWGPLICHLNELHSTAAIFPPDVTLMCHCKPFENVSTSDITSGSEAPTDG